MSFRTVLVVILALVCGAAALLGVATAFPTKQQGPAAATIPTVPVVVAAGDIARHMPLTAEQLQVLEFPKDSVPKGAFSRVEDAVGRVALHAITKKDFIQDQHLAKAGSGQGAAAAIPKGMRAFPIPVGKLAGANSGHFEPGHKVDVLLTVKRRGTDEPETKTLLSKIEVFAVDQTLEPNAPNTKVNVRELRSVTLLVTPIQSTKLSTALSEGVLQLTLRNGEDEQQIVEAPPVAPVQKEPPQKQVETEPPPPPPPSVIRTLRGTQEGEVRLVTTPASRP